MMWFYNLILSLTCLSSGEERTKKPVLQDNLGENFRVSIKILSLVLQTRPASFTLNLTLVLLAFQRSDELKEEGIFT
jgi:hypothetical protein